MFRKPAVNIFIFGLYRITNKLVIISPKKKYFEKMDVLKTIIEL